MRRTKQLGTTLLSLALILSVAAGGLGVGIAGANHPDDAPDLSEYADFEVRFPYTTDHYPGSMNEENGSVQYFASGADAFAEQDAEDGVFIDWIIVHASYEGEDWIDYSACDTENTEAFGIDRGNNNEGTNYDEDLVQKQKRVQFKDNGIVINFYNWEDFGGDPPYMAPEDAIVASQGAGSSGGPCLTVTDEPGWYRIAAFMNGTVADNGPDEQPSDSAKKASLELNSNNYLYVCECQDGQQAREELGPPPNESSTTPTPTPDTPTPTPTTTAEQNDDDTPTPEPETETQTPEQNNDDDTPEPTTADQNDGDGDDDSDESSGDTQMTPTPGAGPGFTTITALLALLAAALLAYRRG